MDASRMLFRRNNALKILTLGYSASGKTYYLGSLHRLRFNTTSPHKFSVKGKDQAAMSRIEEIYRVLANKDKGAILTTVKMDNISLVLQKKMTDLFDIEISDIYGQATQRGRAVDEAQKLIRSLPEYDGVIIFVKAPTNEDEYDDAIDELNTHLDLTAILLNKKQNFPVALVLTQIDKMESLYQIKDEIEREVKQFENQLSADPDMFLEIEQKMKFVRGDIVNPLVGEAMKSYYISDLVRHFYDRLEGYKLARRVFPATSLGFDNAMSNPQGAGTEIAKSKKLNPYGTIASFLWMIYAYTRLNPNRTLSRNYKPSELLEEINDLFTTGQAYHDSSSAVWNMRNLGDINN